MKYVNRRQPLMQVLAALVVSACSGSASVPETRSGGEGGAGLSGGNAANEGGATGAIGGAGAVGDRITIPIEVFGKDGTIVPVSVLALEAAASRGRQLWLKLHNVRYATKASVQVNEGPWVQLSNETVKIEGPAKAFGGIGGGFAVLSMSLNLPPSGLIAGRNTLRFRFDKSNGLSMGYRILAIDVLDADGAHLLSPSQFVQDDPSKWMQPTGANANAGRLLWQTATLVEGPGSTKTLQAHCGDCHAEDGRDLKYFAYTNHSIIERSRFHGLTEAQGKDIAAYVRGIDVGVFGRPWNPPFQPGVGLTGRPLAAFSAGAGIEAVVDEDATLAAIFKDGFDRSSLADGNALRRLPLSDVPVAFQLPDWNHWLPEIHPKDAIGGAFATSLANIRFKALRDRLKEKSESSADLSAYLSNTGNSPFLFPGGGARNDFNGWRDSLWELRQKILKIEPEADFKGPWTDLMSRQVYAAAVWGQVKTWELMNKFGLEDYAPKAYATGESRSWFSERHLFDTSPFLLGIRGGPTCPFVPCNGTAASDQWWSGSLIGNTRVNYEYLSNSWYHLQLSLNGGQRSCGGHRCTDYGYAYGFLRSMLDATGGVYEGGRRLLWGIKAMEERDTSLGPKLFDGFSFATSNPLRPIGLDQDGVIAWWSDRDHPNRKRALEIAVQVWAEKLGSWSVDQWRSENYGKSEDGANFMDGDRVVGEGSDETQMRSLADGFFHGLKELVEVKLHPAVINALARFGAAMWPKNDWRGQSVAAQGPSSSAPTLRSSNGVVTATWAKVAGATSYNLHRATSAQGPWLTVALLRTATSVNDVPAASSKTYFYAVSANQAASESELSPAASISF